MLARLRAKLSFANVASATALFVSLGTGGAYAVTQIDANSVKSKHIVNGQVRSVDVADETIGPDDVSEELVEFPSRPGPHTADTFTTRMDEGGLQVIRWNSASTGLIKFAVTSSAAELFGGQDLNIGEGGFIQIEEGATPPVPPGDAARIFVRDDGANTATSTELMVIFPNGDVDRLATAEAP